MKRALTYLAMVVVLGVAVFFGYRKYKASGPEPIQYKTVKVERGNLLAQVTATGTLSALVTVQVGSQVSGRITALSADFNSQVTKGQVLAKLDPQLFQAAVQREQANMLAAKGGMARSEAQLASAERNYKRAKALVEGGVGTVADLETAQAAYEGAKADIVAQKGQIAQAAAALSQAQINLTYTTVYSPVDGVVISRSVDVGQTVAASLQAPTLFTIAGDLRQMQVDSNVAEADVGKLKPGMPAVFTVDAYPGQDFKGTVRQIRNAPQTVQNVVTYDAVIDVENPDLKLKPGMTANVRFIYAERDDVLRVPNAALRFKPPAEVLAAAGLSADPAGSGGRRQRPPSAAGSSEAGGPAGPGGPGAGGPGAGGPGAGGWQRRQGGDGSSGPRAVWVLRGGAPKRVRVKTGISDGSKTEVEGNDLHEGDDVVTDATLPDGSRPAPAGAPAGGAAPNRGMGRIL